MKYIYTIVICVGLSPFPYAQGNISESSFELLFTPTSGPRGTNVTLFGSNFNMVTEVAFRGIPTDFLVLNDSIIQTEIPSSLNKNGRARIKWEGSVIYSIDTFKLTAAGNLVLNDFHPKMGPAHSKLIIEGDGFLAVDSVRFGRYKAATTILNDSLIEAAVPPLLDQEVKIRIYRGNRMVTSVDKFSPKILINGFQPSSGPSETILTISGKSFSRIVDVSFRGISADFEIISDSSIRTIVPQRLNDDSRIRLKSENETYYSIDTFRLEPRKQLVVSSFNPSKVNIGDRITIKGQGFYGVDSVKFRSVKANFSILNDSIIEVRVPSVLENGRIRVWRGRKLAFTETKYEINQDDILWDQTIGGLGRERFVDICPFPNGNLLTLLPSDSDRSLDKSEDSKGFSDIWLVMLDPDGNIVWDKTLGGKDGDGGHQILKLPSGEFLIAGSTSSLKTKDVSEPSRGGSDFWLLKLDSLGNKIWDKRYGGTFLDGAIRISTAGSDIILAGDSRSPVSGDKTAPNNGRIDFWVLRLDSAGAIRWDRTFGNNGEEYLKDMVTTSTGELLLFGSTQLSRTDDTPNRMYWLLKIDQSGNIIWQKPYGGYSQPGSGEREDPEAITLDEHGNIFLTGTSTTGPGYEKKASPVGKEDIWTLKLDPEGNVIWDVIHGTVDQDFASDIVYKNDRLFVGGNSWGRYGDRSNWYESLDYWLLELDPNTGNLIWERSYGGDWVDRMVTMSATDEFLFLGGQSNSGIGGDKSEEAYNDGGDGWILKIPYPNPISSTLKTLSNSSLVESANYFEVYPNPTTGTITIKPMKSGQLQLVTLYGKMLTDIPMSANKPVAINLALLGSKSGDILIANFYIEDSIDSFKILVK